MPTWPGGSDKITVEAFLKQPRLIARQLTALAAKRFVADVIFARGTSDQIGGGSVLFQKSESLYPDRDPAEVTPRSGFIRTGFSEALFQAFVHEYGLEVPIPDQSKRRNAMDTVARAQIKIANAVVKLVDGLGMGLITSDPDVQTMAASGDWTTAATDIVSDIVAAKGKIDDMDEGYESDTLVVNTAQYRDLLNDKDIRDALPRESNGGVPTVITGKVVPILGLQVIPTRQLTAGTALVLAAKVGGTIADEEPVADEGYQSYPTGNGFRPIYAKTYREENTNETIVRGARFPVMWLSEPKSIVKITGA